MKLATLADGSRDGQLIVVSRDLATAHFATGIAGTLQQVLDDWNFRAPPLEDLSAALNAGRARHAFPFEPRACMAPLPRAFQWLASSAWPHAHDTATAPEQAGSAPTLPASLAMLQGPSDDFLGPRDAAVFDRADQGIDVEWGLAVVSADVAQGSAPDAALESVRLLMLVNAWCLRDAAAGLHRRPAVACGPVAVTPDEPGRAWAAGRLRLDLACWRNGALLGRAQTGRGDGFHFGELISHAAQTRRLRAGGIVGALAPACSEGVSCIAQQRDAESEGGEAPRTPYLQTGDTLRVEALARDGASIFGAIEQTVTAAAADQA